MQQSVGKSGKEIVPVEVVNKQQRQQDLTSTGMEIVTANVATTQQIQIANKFGAFENEESEADGDNQLAIANTNNVLSQITTSQATRKSLNAASPTFTPKSAGAKASNKGNGTKDDTHIREKRQEQRKESTAQ